MAVTWPCLAASGWEDPQTFVGLAALLLLFSPSEAPAPLQRVSISLLASPTACVAVLSTEVVTAGLLRIACRYLDLIRIYTKPKVGKAHQLGLTSRFFLVEPGKPDAYLLVPSPFPTLRSSHVSPSVQHHCHQAAGAPELRPVCGFIPHMSCPCLCPAYRASCLTTTTLWCCRPSGAQ